MGSSAALQPDRGGFSRTTKYQLFEQVDHSRGGGVVEGQQGGGVVVGGGPGPADAAAVEGVGRVRAGLLLLG